MNWVIAWTVIPKVDEDRWSRWNRSCAAEYRHIAINMMETLSRASPNRMYGLFRNRPPQGWLGTKPQIVMGANENDLYRAKYGEDLPISSAAGSLVENNDRLVV